MFLGLDCTRRSWWQSLEKTLVNMNTINAILDLKLVNRLIPTTNRKCHSIHCKSGYACGSKPRYSCFHTKTRVSSPTFDIQCRPDGASLMQPARHLEWWGQICLETAATYQCSTSFAPKTEEIKVYIIYIYVCVWYGVCVDHGLAFQHFVARRVRLVSRPVAKLLWRSTIAIARIPTLFTAVWSLF